ncbi:MAG: NAD(+) kinase, partial [Pedobacter sp.]
MKIAIYGREFNDSVLPFVQQVFNALSLYKIEIVVYSKFHNFIKDKVTLPTNTTTFSGHKDLLAKGDVLLSLGGDGTLLDTLSLVRDSQIPVIGINFGRLGFLASINKNEIDTAIDALVKGEYSLDKRGILSLESKSNLFD